MRKDRKSIKIMMMIIVLVSIIFIVINNFLIHNYKENKGNTVVESNGIGDKQYAVGVQENTIQVVNDVTPEASITEDNTEAKIQDIEEQNTTQQDSKEQNTVEHNIKEEHTIASMSDGTYYIDGASSVNIRSAAYNQSKVVGWLAKGTEVEMIKEGKYYSYIKHGNMEGYVYNEYISQK